MVLMRGPRYFVFGMAAALAFWAGMVSAASPEDLRRCRAASEPEEVIDTCSRAIRQSPRGSRPWREAMLGRADAFFFQNAFFDAIEDYSSLIVSDPGDFQALYNRGRAYREIGAMGFATGDFNRALRLRPNDPRVLKERGIARHGMGDYLRAFDDLTKAIEVGRVEAEPVYHRANALRALGDVLAASRDYRLAQRLEPVHPDYLLGLCWVELQVGNHPAAIRACDAALEKDPRHIEARGWRAFAALVSGDVERAERLAKDVLARVPLLAEAIYVEAAILRAKGDRARSEARLAEAEFVSVDWQRAEFQKLYPLR